MIRQSTFYWLWALMVGINALIILIILSVMPTRAETCYRKIDNNVQKLAGYKWQHRTVDSKQCWFYSNRLLPATDLVWSFTEEEFNSDIDRVLERKFYKPVTDESREVDREPD